MPAKNWDSRPGDKNTILFDVQTRLNRKKAEALFGQRRNPESPVAESVQISLCGRKKLIAPFYDLQ